MTSTHAYGPGTEITLNDGVIMPQVGFGVWQVKDDEAQPAVEKALEVGYRNIDTAAVYQNEAGVGRAILASGLARVDFFVTTKLWNDDQGTDTAFVAFEKSLDLLGLDFVDLYLIHWASPKRGLYKESWETLIKIQESGRARAIGVSNFAIEHLEVLSKATGVVPAVNQIELHPFLQQRELQEYNTAHNIVTEAWSPLAQGKSLDNELLLGLGAKHDKTVAQIVIRWHMQSDRLVIPKSTTPHRIAENFDVFDFALDADDMNIIAELDSGNRLGADPATAEF
ncbi:aldo/keto reductase [Alpinimonas psychrophila]|uniref:2,5-diketo-D-gluconate reductase A n=1 Tax=Alpinimonas psychrophila TaxID=748908 RepID=A0A7W3JUE9_9MICO|nr:aldo/keto reductase [Alpinimonas psychrophila]MBA8829453.1 2,5-diketo-D-gluconate reductase A [Alpinimonas psychrophila]